MRLTPAESLFAYEIVSRLTIALSGTGRPLGGVGRRLWEEERLSYEERGCEWECASRDVEYPVGRTTHERHC
jgi:hypothetical protein